MKPALITQLKCVVVSAFVSLAFVSQASAVLRPLFPIKPAAPFNGEVIIIGDELVLPSAKSLCWRTEPAKVASAWTAMVPAFDGASFVLDIAWQRAYERTCR